MKQEILIDEQISSLRYDLAKVTKQKSAEVLIQQMAKGTWIYGAGNYGRQIAALLAERDIPCLGFIDQRGEQIAPRNDVPVLPPDAFKSSMASGKTCLICVFNPGTWAPDILPWAESQGFDHVLWGADLPEALGSEAGSFWLTSRRDVEMHFEPLRRAACHLSDRQSVEIFFSILRFRLWADPASHPPIDPDNQYLPRDIAGFDRPITFVDGGAYNGDTFRFLRQAGVDIRHLIAFEPDLENFSALTKSVSETAVPATLFPCGLSDRSHQVTFQGGMGTGSRIEAATHAPANSTTINCVALDDVIHETTIDFVKCDIEGAESAALKGMTKTLSRARPRVAISLYHKPRDLWELINQTSDLLPDSQFHIRQHAGNSLETVLYALPRR